MVVHLTPGHEAFIAQAVTCGRFGSPDEALRAAVGLLELQERELTERELTEHESNATRAFVLEGVADIEAGHYEDFADDNLHDLFSDIARRGRDRLVAERRT